MSATWRDMRHFSFPRRCVLLAGGEGHGVSREILNRMVVGFDAVVYIPMPGPHKSMNVATALGCAMYEFRRQWPPQMITQSI